MKNDKSGNGWGSWILIIVLFGVGLSPIALLLLLLKLFRRDKPKQSRNPVPQRTGGKKNDLVGSVIRSPRTKKSTYIALIVGGSLLGLGGLGLTLEAIDMMIWLGEIESYYIEDVVSGMLALIGGVAMICSGTSISRALKRYAKYMAVIGHQTCVSTASLVKTLGYSQRQVEKDFSKMIENDYFGSGAYYNVELDHLFIDSVAEAAWRERQKAEQPPEPEVESVYTATLRELRNANDRIEDAVLSEKIERLENITARIFRAIESDPEKKKRVDTFLNYYLPTTQKLLDSYAEFEAAGVEGEHLKQAKSRIETTMDNIIQGFERQLDELYRFDALDIDTDIQVLETMMAREGLAGEEMKTSSDTQTTLK